MTPEVLTSARDSEEFNGRLTRGLAKLIGSPTEVAYSVISSNGIPDGWNQGLVPMLGPEASGERRRRFIRGRFAVAGALGG